MSEQERAPAWWRRLPWNPILTKEILVYERGSSISPNKSAINILIWGLIAIALLAYAAYVPGALRFAGRALGFGALGILSLTSFAVSVPASTSIALERDRGTFDTLSISALGSGRLVRGKILAAMAVGLHNKAPILPACGILLLFGGLPVEILPPYLIYLLAVDFAYAAYGVSASALEHRPPKVQAYMKPPTQAQLSIQRGASLAVVSVLGMIYVFVFLLPMALKRGSSVPAVLEQGRLLGALHPLVCLVLWGPIKVFSLSLPLWLVGTLFHILLGWTFMSQAVDRLRPRSAELGRQSRLSGLVVFGFLFLYVLGAVWSAPGLRLPAVLILGLLVLLAAVMKVGFARDKRGAPSRRELAAALLRPWDALRPRARGAPLYLLSLALLVGGAVVMAAAPIRGGLGAALKSLAGFALFSLAFGLAGARANARARREESEALLGLVTAPPEGAGEEEEKARDRELRGLPLLVIFLAMVLPLVAWAAARSARIGKLPLSANTADAIGAVGAVALAFNPLASALPLVEDPAVIGSAVPIKMLAELGVSPHLIFGLHLIIYGLVAALSLLFYPRPPHGPEALLAALDERRRGEAAGPSPEADA